MDWKQTAKDYWKATLATGVVLSVRLTIVTKSGVLHTPFVCIGSKPRWRSSTRLCTPSVFKGGTWHRLKTEFSVRAAKRAAEAFATSGAGTVESTYTPEDETPQCTCMAEDETGRVATPSGSCPEHGYLVDQK